MISKPKEPTVIGVNKEIPEGIFGAVDMPENNSNSENGKRKFLQIGDHRIELTDMEHNLSLKNGQKKKKKKIKGKAKVKTITAESIKPPKKKKKRIGVMPALQINYEATLPEEAEGLTLDNVVSVPEEMLQRISRVTEKRTRELSKLMLHNVTPAVLSYDAASNYVQAALSDGLNIDVDIDRGVLDVVKELSRLDVIFFYIKRLKIPKSLKEHFMKTFVEELSKTSLDALKKADKSEAISGQLRELEAVISKRSEHQKREQDVRKSKAKRTGMMQDRIAEGTKRTRKDAGTTNAPLMGGF